MFEKAVDLPDPLLRAGAMLGLGALGRERDIGLIEAALSDAELDVRLAAVNGDKQLQQPVLMDVGMEAWRAKESKVSEDEMPALGPAEKRGPIWEAITATDLLQSGGDLIVMRHPDAMRMVRKTIERLAAAP